jgi:hypothetical protein
LAGSSGHDAVVRADAAEGKEHDALIAAVADVLEGFTASRSWISTTLSAGAGGEAGVLTNARPTSAMLADFEFGYRIADAIAGR